MHTELLAAPDEPQTWARFADLPEAARESTVDALKEQLDLEVRANPPAALALADVLFRAAELTPTRRAVGHRGRAVARHVNERSDEALADYEAALALYAAAGAELEVARLERALGDLHNQAGRPEESLACAERARVVFERLGETRQLAQLFVNIGNVHFRREDLAAARAAYAEAAAGFRGLDDELGLGVANFSRANVEVFGGHYDEADEAFAAARGVFADKGLDSHVAECDYGRAWMLSRRCRFAEAIAALEAAREAFRAGNRPSRAPLCDLDLAELYLRLDARWDALDRASAAAEAFAELDLRYELAKSLAVRGLARRRAADHEAALVDLAAAAEHFEALGNRSQVLALGIDRAATLLATGAADRALAELTPAHAELAGGDNLLLEDLSSVLLARAHTQAGDPTAALALLAPWRAVADPEGTGEQADRATQGGRGRRATDMLLEVEALRAAAEALVALDEPAGAIRELAEATRRIDRTYSAVPGSDARLAFFRDRHGAFAELARLQADAGRPDEALATLEHGRARDQRSTARARFEASARPGARSQAPGQVDDRAEREHLDALLLRRLDADLGALTGNVEAHRAGPGDDELLAAERALLQRHRETGSAPTLARTGAAELRATLGPGEVALAYLASDQDLGVLVVDAETTTWTPLPGALEALGPLAARLELALAKRLVGRRSPAHEARSRATLDGLLAELGERLIAPAAVHLAGASRLLVLPYGGLHGLPFHAFGHGGAPLAAAFEVTYAPALSLVAERRGRAIPGARRVLAVTSDEASLPALAEEAAALRGVHGAALEELPVEALEARLADSAMPAAALHLAAHGAFQPHNPIFSGLSFGDRVLTAHDVRGLDLELELVTLSGCETGRSERLEGEDLVGIDQAFLAAGARAVVSSMWVVDDRIAATTMAALHRELAAGRRVGEALAGVQRGLIAAGEHPFDWAPFVVTGDASARLGIQSDPHQGAPGE